MDKFGGNGLIMVNVIFVVGCKFIYIGVFGQGVIYFVFVGMVVKVCVVFFCVLVVIIVVEFNDGKIMFGQMKLFDEIIYDKIVEVMGWEDFYV